MSKREPEGHVSFEQELSRIRDMPAWNHRVVSSMTKEYRGIFDAKAILFCRSGKKDLRIPSNSLLTRGISNKKMAIFTRFKMFFFSGELENRRSGWHNCHHRSHGRKLFWRGIAWEKASFCSEKKIY
jgi:hypothetical protein